MLINLCLFIGCFKKRTILPSSVKFSHCRVDYIISHSNGIWTDGVSMVLVPLLNLRLRFNSHEKKHSRSLYTIKVP